MARIATIGRLGARFAHRAALEADAISAEEALIALSQALAVAPCEAWLALRAKFTAESASLAVFLIAWADIFNNPVRFKHRSRVLFISISLIIIFI